MTEAQTNFSKWIDCLLDPSRTPIDQLNASREWYAWGMRQLDIDEANLHCANAGFVTETPLSSGLAISLIAAARCVQEYRRTAVFLQAMDAAIQAARARFPGETIHVLEAGCGPLAPLALAMAVRYPPEEVQFTLLDLHEASIHAAQRIAVALGVASSLRACVTADATQWRCLPEERPHIIACEMLLRALTREPQVAATLNLAPQLRPEGFFLPECIAIDGVLFNSGAYFRLAEDNVAEAPPDSAAIVELGRVFTLQADALDSLVPLSESRYAAATLHVPPHDRASQAVQFFTRIRVFGMHVLGDFESSLNQPLDAQLPREMAGVGGEASFIYEVSAEPGLRLVTRE